MYAPHYLGIGLTVIGCFGLGAWAVWAYLSRLGWEPEPYEPDDTDSAGA